MASTRFEWQIGEDDWPDRPPEPPRPPGRRIRLPRRAVAALLVAILLVGAVVAYRYRANSTALRAALLDTIEQETLVWNSGATPAYAELLDPSAPESWRSDVLAALDAAYSRGRQPKQQVSVQRVDWRGDVAAVTVDVTQTPGWRPYRWQYRPASLTGRYPQVYIVDERSDDPVQSTETHFYHLIDGTWRRTAADPRFLGPQEKILTSHFDLRYYHIDAPAARQLADELEATVADLTRRYGQSPLSDGQRLLIRLMPDLSSPVWDDIGVDVPAPSTAPQYEWETTETRLLRPTRAMLVGRMIDQLLGDHPNALARALAIGIMEHELDGVAPGDWRNIHTRALIWGWSGESRPLLSVLTDSPPGGSDWPAFESWLLVRYIASRYGDARLAELVRLAPGAGSWDTLIQHGLGINLADFDTGWWGAIAGEYIMAPYRDDPAHLRTDLQAAVQADVKALSDRSPARSLQNLDPRASAWWRAAQLQTDPLVASGQADVQVEPVQVQDDIALVMIQVRSPSGELKVTQYRFYRFDGDRWWHTQPVEAMWGQRRTLETTHFRAIYFERDTSAVEAAFADLDTLYTSFQTDFDLPPLSTSQLITVEIAPAKPERPIFFYFPSRSFGAIVEVVPADPERLGSPPGRPAIVLPSPLIAGYGPDGPAPELSRNLGFALGLLMLHYANAVGTLPSPESPDMETFINWELDGWHPPSPSIQAETDARLKSALTSDTLIPLGDLNLAYRQGDDQAQLAWDEMAILLDYVADTYGRSHLGDVLRAQLRYSNWWNTVRTTLGKPADQVETEWRQYLAARYGQGMP